MEGEEIVPNRNGKELRKQKLTEYLAAKGRLKLPNPKPYLRNNIKAETATVTNMKADLANGKENSATGKENRGPNNFKTKGQSAMVHSTSTKAVVKRNLCSTTNKQGSTTSSTLHPLSDALITARLNALKSTSKMLVRGHPASLTTVPARPNSNVSIRMCSGPNSQTRLHPNPTVKNNYSRPVSSLGPSAAVPRPSAAVPRPSAAVPRPSAAVPRPSAAGPRPSAAGPLPKTVAKAKVGRDAPRITQPRSAISAPTTFFCNKGRSNAALPIPAVTQKLVGTQQKTNPFTAVCKPNQRTGALSVEDEPKRSTFLSRTYSKTLPRTTGKMAGLKQPVSRPKPSSQDLTSPGSKTAVMKPVDEGKLPLMKKSKVLVREVVPAKRAPPQHKAGAITAGAPAAWTRKPVHRASEGLAGSQWQVKALSRAMHEAVAKMGWNCSGEDNREATSDGNTSTPLGWSNNRIVNGAWIPQTMPHVTTESSHEEAEMGWEAGVGLKTPRDQARVIPQTEGRKKMTAAQEERIQKLQEWRERKGISYKRPPMPVRPFRTRRTVALPQPYWATMEDEDVEAKSLVGAVDQCLADCIKLLDEGCPSTQVQEMLSSVPMAKKFSKYWICLAHLMERQGDLDVLPLFEEAVRVVLEPVDELRTVVFEMLKKKEERQGLTPVVSEEEEHILPPASRPEPAATPKAVKALICGERGGSSVVKYKITTTPGGFRSQQREQGVTRRVDGHKLRFFTPVRRSVRIEGTTLHYPASLQEHDVCVASFNDLMAQEERTLETEREGDQEGRGSAVPAPNDHLYVYRENEALRDQVSIQLVYAEED